MELGTRLGTYEIAEPLGAGGMGEVYRARDTTLGRDVALKLLPRDTASDPELLGRLRREARTLAALNHPNIATVHGFEEHEGKSFIVMELVEGPTVADRLEAGPMPVVDALDAAAQIARALEAAHERGIVHRDLKPANLKLAEDGRIKVLDFGLAKLVATGTLEPGSSRLDTETVEATAAGRVMGTPLYMSPEQARGRSTDGRTDIWSFACVLHEMLTGEQAFGRATVADTLTAIMTETPDTQSLPAETPVAVRKLLERMLAKDPEERVASMGRVRSALEDSAAGLRHGRPERRRVARIPLRWVVATAMLVAAVAGGWWLLVGGVDPDETDRSIAVLPFETLGRTEPSVFTDGVHGDMLTRLSRVGDLRVTSRTSVLQYREPDRALPEIARELGVTWVLLGEVQEVGNQVQVNARLVNALEDRQVWAQSYRRELTAENLFDIQSDLTEEIADQLEARLTAGEIRTGRRPPTDNLDAYRLYVRGVRHLEGWTEDEMRRAASLYQEAIELDPDYALAWAGLADANSLLRWYGFAPVADVPGPEEASRRALVLAPDLAEAHLSRAIVLSSREVRDAPEAIRELEKATSLQPSLAIAYVWMAWLHLLTGDAAAAVEPAELAVELDPLAPAAHVFLAEVYLATGRLQEALDAAVRGRELQPEKPLSLVIEALALYHLGELDDAERVLDRALSLVPPEGTTPTRTQVRAVLAVIAARSDEPSRAQETLDVIDETGDRVSAGLVHAALGDTEQALDAFESVDTWGQLSNEILRYFFPEVLGRLRGTPRYEVLLRRADASWGLNPDAATD